MDVSSLQTILYVRYSQYDGQEKDRVICEWYQDTFNVRIKIVPIIDYISEHSFCFPSTYTFFLNKMVHEQFKNLNTILRMADRDTLT